MTIRKIPKFENEAQEAKWWFDNREAIGEDLVAAVRERGPGEGSLGRLARKKREESDRLSSPRDEVSTMASRK